MLVELVYHEIFSRNGLISPMVFYYKWWSENADIWNMN
jgi:hypothetical protein